MKRCKGKYYKLPTREQMQQRFTFYPQCSRKTVQAVIRSALTGKRLLLTSQAGAEQCKEIARQLGVEIPEPAVWKPRRLGAQGVGYCLMIMDEGCEMTQPFPGFARGAGKSELRMEAFLNVLHNLSEKE